MIFYHRTTSESAKSILQTGFVDGHGKYMTSEMFSGVWISDQPLDANEGARGNTLLALTFDAEFSESDLAPYEWVEEHKGYREWLVPAALLNQKSTVQIEEVDEDPPWLARR